jgi:hypothetical protein
MRAIQVAIVQEDTGLRCFFIAEDDTTQVLRLLRTGFPSLLRIGKALHVSAAQ